MFYHRATTTVRILLGAGKMTKFIKKHFFLFSAIVIKKSCPDIANLNLVLDEEKTYFVVKKELAESKIKLFHT
jgi:hypothetical protein